MSKENLFKGTPMTKTSPTTPTFSKILSITNKNPAKLSEYVSTIIIYMPILFKYYYENPSVLAKKYLE